MKNFTYIMTFLLIFSCAHQGKSISQKEILTYCQDLNVLYTRINLIQSNIVNKNTTRTVEGGPYKRRYVKSCQVGHCEIAVDESAPMLKYEPKHPDANDKGYVAYPMISVESEEADRLFWERAYSTVIENSPVPKDFFFKDARAKECFNNFPNVLDRHDYSNYLGRETNKN